MKNLPIGKILPLVLGLILGAGALTGASYALGSGPFSPKVEPPKEVHPPEGVMIPMRERIVNLADTGILRYLKTTIVLEVIDPENPHPNQAGGGHGEAKKGKEELPKDLSHKSAAIEDKITTILSSKTAAGLMTLEGKAALKMELKNEINNLIHEERILSVYFTDFIVQ